MLELVKHSVKHKENLIRILNNENVAKWLIAPPYPYTEKDADEFIMRCKAEEGSVKNFRYALEYEGEFIGSVGLFVAVNNSAGTGYYLDEKFWGRGFMSEALNKVLELAFNKLNLNSVFAFVLHGNISSEKLLLKCGFKEEETNETFTKNGKTYNSKLFIKNKN